MTDLLTTKTIHVEKADLSKLVEEIKGLRYEIYELRERLDEEKKEEFPTKMRIPEAAKILGYHPNHVHRLCRDGVLRKYWDERNNPYVLGEDVKKLKYGKNWEQV